MAPPCRLARQQGQAEERRAREGELQRCGDDLAERDAQLAGLQRQLRQLHSELQSATAGLEAASASHAAEAQGAAARLAAAQRSVMELAGAARLLLGSVAQLGAAAAAAAASRHRSSQVGSAGWMDVSTRECTRLQGPCTCMPGPACLHAGCLPVACTHLSHISHPSPCFSLRAGGRRCR